MPITQKHRQAALVYFLYGIIYLGGAVYVAMSGISTRTAPAGSGWIYYALGVLAVLIFPLLIARGYKWFTRVLSILVIYRIFEMTRLLFRDNLSQVPLPWGGEMPMLYGIMGFIFVAALTAAMLVRSGWDI